MSLIISTHNYIDNASYTMSTNLTMVSGLGLAELRRPLGAGVARTTSNAFWFIDVDLLAPRRVDVIACLGANISGAGVSQNVSLSANASNVTAGGSEAGGFSATWGYTDDSPTKGVFAAPASSITARYWRLFPAWDTLDAFLQLRRLWIGAGFRRDSGADIGWGMRPASRTSVTRADGEDAVVDARELYWKLNLSVSPLDQSAMFGNSPASDYWFAAQMARAKRGSDMVVMVRSNTDRMRQMSSLYGLLAPELEPPLTNVGSDSTYRGQLEVHQLPLQ